MRLHDCVWFEDRGERGWGFWAGGVVYSSGDWGVDGADETEYWFLKKFVACGWEDIGARADLVKCDKRAGYVKLRNLDFEADS